MKNRSRELGLYSVLGLEKRHLFSMILKETVIMSFVTLLLGIGVGALFDKLIYAFLQRLIGESTGFGFDLSSNDNSYCSLSFFCLYF